MNPHFRRVAQICFQNAVIVADRYHVVRQVYWAMERVRKTEQTKLSKRLRKYFKKSRSLLSKSIEKLTEEEMNRLSLMFEIAPRLADAYRLKNEFLSVIRTKSSADRKQKLLDWLQSAEIMDLSEFYDCTKAYRNWFHEILIFDEPTAVLTPQEIDELMAIMKNLTAEGKSILFISHKLNEIMAVADRVTVLRKGRYVGTVNTCDTNKQELSNMMVGRPVQLEVVKEPAKPTDVVLKVRDLCVPSHTHKRNAVDHVSFDARAGEILCIAGIDGNGQTEFIHALTGLDKSNGGTVTLCGKDISHASIRRRGECMSHIPEDRHKHGLVLDFTLEQNLVLQRYKEPEFEKGGFIKKDAVRAYAERLIEEYDIRSGQGPVTTARSMSGGNQQKAIIAREVDRNKPLIVAVQPTRGLDVGAIENVHKELVKQRDAGKAVLLVSLELDEVMSLSDRILVMYEGEIVGEFDPKQITVQELGLYMAGAKRADKKEGETA